MRARARSTTDSTNGGATAYHSGERMNAEHWRYTYAAGDWSARAAEMEAYGACKRSSQASG